MIYSLILAVVLLVIILILIVLIILSVKPTYSQTMTVEYNFSNCKRYLPTADKLQNLDRIKIKIASKYNINIPDLNTLVDKCIIQGYDSALLVYEGDIFVVESKDKYRRIPISKIPSIENLSLIFFNDLSAVLKPQRIRLVSVTVYADGLKACHERQAGHTPTE